MTSHRWFPAQPLFVHNQRAWVTAWACALGVGVLLALALATFRAGSWQAFSSLPAFPTLMLGTAGLIVWSAAGLRLHRRWSGNVLFLLTFMTGGCALMLWLGELHDDFGLLSFVVVLQVFIFLPFVLAVLAVLIIVGISVADTALRLRPQGIRISPDELTWEIVSALAGGLLMTAIIGYMHSVNRQVQVRQELIERLEATQRDLAQREREAGILSERARLSRDLHDTLAQGFTSIVTQLSAAELALNGPEPAARQQLLLARRTARDHLGEIRRLVWALRPSALETQPLEHALRRAVADWSARTGVVAAFTVVGETVALRPEADVALLRTVQEALANIERHAGARHVEVLLGRDEGYVMLDVADDGQGFSPEQPRLGFGLLGLNERLAALGGRLLLDSTPGEGTTVTAALPLLTAVPHLQAWP
ncbi:sensor histidine kinase [Deinococcus koreensis]|nr:sensor histidine kinase [Deinococcus koreensis]